MKRTKIICTLGPASTDEDVLRQLIRGGMDIARFNFSHGSYEEHAARFAQDAFMNDYFRVYTSGDIVGVELAGALKNVIALSCGVCDGLGYQDNTKALLMTRAMAETTWVRPAPRWRIFPRRAS